MLKSKKKILITGGLGFLGKALVEKLSNNYEIIIYDKKNNKNLNKKKIFPIVDIVIHLAAYNSTKDFYEDSFNVMYDNLQPTINLLRFYRTLKKKILFIYTGTPEIAVGAVEKYNYKIPTDEKVPYVISDPLNKRWSYANSKAVGEQLVICSGLQYIIIRPHNVYGKSQKNHFIPEFIERLKKGKIELKGWKNKRSWLYIDDFVDAFYRILNNKKCVNEIINIGSNFEYSVLSVAKIILKELKINRKIHKMKAPVGSALRRVPDIRKIKKLTGWYPRIDIHQGIKKICKKV